MVEFQIIRSDRRKTLSLQVRHGKIVVRAPHFVDNKTINTLVNEKSAWLKAKVIEQSQRQGESCCFSQGSPLYILGQLVSLKVSFGIKSETYFLQEAAEFHIVFARRYEAKLTDQAKLQIAVKKQLEAYFKQLAQTIIPEKVSYYSAVTQLQSTSIKIRQYRARWGSCNSRGELSFNYLMMMLPDDVINYIVVHELCHLRFLNHSTDFWQLVAKYFPDYKQAKLWLRNHQSKLSWQLP